MAQNNYAPERSFSVLDDLQSQIDQGAYSPAPQEPESSEESEPVSTASPIDQSPEWVDCAYAVYDKCPSIAWKNRNFVSGTEREKCLGVMLHAPAPAGINALTLIRDYYDQYYLFECDNQCMNAVIDGEAGTLLQVLPWQYVSSHCGGAFDQTHIGLAMTCPDSHDRSAYLAAGKRNFEMAADFCADLCAKYGLDPLGTSEGLDGKPHCSVVISHWEGSHLFGKASPFYTPEDYWDTLKPDLDYNMDLFRHTVKERMLRLRDAEAKQ